MIYYTIILCNANIFELATTRVEISDTSIYFMGKVLKRKKRLQVSLDKSPCSLGHSQARGSFIKLKKKKGDLDSRTRSKYDHETSINMFTCVGNFKSMYVLQLCPSRDKFGLLFHLWKSCFTKQKLSFLILFGMSFFKISVNVT